MFIILVLCETVKMDIEPCANSMWTESIVRDCYVGQAEKNEGRACLSVKMMPEKLYVLASYCQCEPSESEQLGMWKNLMAHLLPSLAILDQSVETLSIQFKEIKILLEQIQEDKHGATFRQSKMNHRRINKLHKRLS